jgi:hypothetical protein
MSAGYLYGTRSARTYYHPPAFLDLDYRRPDFGRHLAEVAEWRPRYAVAGDAEAPAELDRVLSQAEALRPHAERVIVVPKTSGLVDAIPDWCVVGLSVPTSFGGTLAAMWEYSGRRVHLLGGNPRAQLTLRAYLGEGIVSVDGNSHQRAAMRGVIWERGGWVSRDAARSLEGPGDDLPYRCFARSCRNIAAAWRCVAGAAN